MRSAKVDNEKLRRIRERRGLSAPVFVGFLAAALGRDISLSMVCKVENGDRQPGAELFSAWCDVLGIPDTDDARDALLLPDARQAGAA